MSRCIDLTGQKFGRLTVIERNGSNNHKEAVWRCKCVCGNEINVGAYDLKSGHTKSCGCYKRENPPNLKHGQTNSRLNEIWSGMKKRCFNPKSTAYDRYGGRGITVCDEWRNDFKAFYDWAMANGYNDTLSIERIDTNGNYEPMNCRWATQKEQANNKRSNRRITYNGTTQTLAQWADELNISYKKLYHRIVELSWDIERALTTP